VSFERDAFGHWSASHPGVECVDCGNLPGREFEIEHVEILGNAGGLGGLRDRGATLLKVPTKHHLRGRLAVHPRDVLQRRIVEAALSSSR